MRRYAEVTLRIRLLADDEYAMNAAIHDVLHAGEFGDYNSAESWTWETVGRRKVKLLPTKRAAPLTPTAPKDGE